MAVFWFGWAKKLKNIFTKTEADRLYLQKTSNTSQTVDGPVALRSSIELGTEIKAGYGGGSVKFIPEDNSTKTLQFYNNNATDTRRFKLLVPDPTEAQNPATKQYVDNKTTLDTIISSGTTVKYSNLQKINENIFDDTATYDYTKPVYVSFTRYNNNVNMGRWTETIMYSQDNPYWMVATNMYRSNSTQNMEIGKYAGLLITRSFIQIQCWDANDRISDITVKAHLR